MTPLAVESEGENSRRTNPNQALLLALQNAVSDREQATAEGVIERLSERELSDQDQALVAGFQRILTGRVLASGMRFGLNLREEEGRRNLYMSLESRGQEALELIFPPITLEYACLVLNEAGEINRQLSSQVMHPLGGLELAAGAKPELLLGECPATFPKGAFAVRDAWRVAILPGHIRTQQGTFPAERMPRPELSVDTLAPALQGERVQPAEFADSFVSVLAGADVSRDELLASAARLDPERRDELLPLLAAALGEYGNPLRDQDGRLATAVLPSLRWISPSADVDSSLSAWSRWTAGWVQRSAQKERSKNRSGLVLP